MKAKFNMNSSLCYQVVTEDGKISLFKNDVLISKIKSQFSDLSTLYTALSLCVKKASDNIDKQLKKQAKEKWGATMNNANVRWEFCMLQDQNMERKELWLFRVYFCRFLENSFYSQIIDNNNIEIECNQ